MDPADNLRTLRELEAIRDNLLYQIAQAELNFPAQKNSPAIHTSKAALKSIEQLIEAQQKRAVA